MAGSFLRLVRFWSSILSIFISYLYSCINVSLSNDSSRFTPALLFIPEPTYHFHLFWRHFFRNHNRITARSWGSFTDKVGQTIGIVGGIVIGQASVEAALTSTILLIAVALSALASLQHRQ